MNRLHSAFSLLPTSGHFSLESASFHNKPFLHLLQTTGPGSGTKEFGNSGAYPLNSTICQVSISFSEVFFGGGGRIHYFSIFWKHLTFPCNPFPMLSGRVVTGIGCPSTAIREMKLPERPPSVKLIHYFLVNPLTQQGKKWFIQIPKVYKDMTMRNMGNEELVLYSEGTGERDVTGVLTCYQVKGEYE